MQQPSGSWSQTYAYDSAKRLSSVTSPAGTFGYTYSSGVGSASTASTLWKKLALFNGSSTYITNIFDSSARLTSTTLRNSSHTELNKHDYLYNLANQRTNQVRTDASYVNYTYDPIGQLQSAFGYTSSHVPIAADTKGYKYDAAQNLNVRTNNGSPATFSVNVKNELTGATYDANGNATSLNSHTHTYDAENRLTQVIGYNYTFRHDFTYDGFGRLRLRHTYAYSGGVWNFQSAIEYIYDGWTVVQERDYGNTPTVSYTRGSDLSGTFQGAGGIGGLLARSSSLVSGSFTNHHAYHADGGGNITGLVATNQNISANYRYDSFGNLISSSGTMASANTYRFSSKEWIANADLYYYGYRFYSPNYQRWINQDPIGERGGINLYQFAGNSPLNRVDPIGEVAPFIALCAAAAADYVAEKALDYVGNNMVPDDHKDTFDKVRGAYDAASSLNPGKAGRKAAKKLGNFLKGDDVKEAAEHAAQVGPVKGVVDRAGAEARRAERMKDHPTVPGKDRDEYPPAVIKPQDPNKVSVKPIDPSHNRRSGSRLRNELPPDGTPVEIVPPNCKK